MEDIFEGLEVYGFENHEVKDPAMIGNLYDLFIGYNSEKDYYVIGNLHGAVYSTNKDLEKTIEEFEMNHTIHKDYFEELRKTAECYFVKTKKGEC